MELDSITCNNCGATEWSKVLEDDYPERRAERDRTVKTVYTCKECDAEGKHFEHKGGTADTFSGAFR